MQSVAIDGLRATLHPASGRRGVLIIGSLGFEDLCSHRFLLALASECARHGVPALRLDLRGTGDSAPAQADGALVAAWTQDIVRAARWMRQDQGCSELCIVGLRLGALLAGSAMADPALADARLALLAAPASGKAYVRELKMFARVVAAPPTAPGLDGLDLAGFHLAPPVLTGIQTLDWVPLVGTKADVLVVGQQPPALAAAFATGGHAVSDLEFEGYDRLMCDPTASIVPGGLVRRIGAWLTHQAPPGLRRRPPDHGTSILQPAWREDGLSFGPQGRLDGILCQPSRASGGPLVVFTNPGGIRRTGWGNMWVDMARHLAAEGIASLRFDFTNLVPDLDSDLPGGHYGDDTWSEVSAAADLAETLRLGPVLAVGACSGAYHCLRAANLDPRITGAVLVNQLCYDWSAAHAVPLAAWMRQKAGDFDRKRRALDEDVSEWARIGARLMVESLKLAKRSAKGALRQLRAVSTLLPGGAAEGRTSAEQMIRHLASRGCVLEIVQAEGDPSIAEYDRAVGLASGAVPGLTRTIVPDADHLLTPLAARRAVLQRIEAVVAREAAQERRMRGCE